jgi:hypothetical protein
VPRNISSLADTLAHRFRSLEATRVRIEGLARRGSLSQRAVLQMYEGLFLSAHVAAESFLEELFLGLLVTGRGITSARNDVLPRLEIRSHAVARELITGPSKNYVDWVPFDRTITLAKLFFRGGRPFSDLNQQHKDTLFKSHIIRNVIAHRSRHSVKQFDRHIIGSASLPPSERNPAGYLRGFFRVTPAQTRFSNLLAQLLLCARDLAK